MAEAQTHSDVCGGESREYLKVDIDEDFVASLYAKTEPVRFGTTKLYPTPRQEKILRDLWPRNTIRRADIAKALGVAMSTARRWAEEMEARVDGH